MDQPGFCSIEENILQIGKFGLNLKTTSNPERWGELAPASNHDSAWRLAMDLSFLRFLATIATDNDAMTAYLKDPDVAMAKAGLSDEDIKSLKSGVAEAVVQRVLPPPPPPPPPGEVTYAVRFGSTAGLPSSLGQPVPWPVTYVVKLDSTSASDAGEPVQGPVTYVVNLDCDAGPAQGVGVPPPPPPVPVPVPVTYIVKLPAGSVVEIESGRSQTAADASPAPSVKISHSGPSVPPSY